VIKSRRVRWATYEARVGEGKDAYSVWWGDLTERAHFKDPGIDGRITVKYILKKLDGGHGLD
jgi:hypothetical protein